MKQKISLILSSALAIGLLVLVFRRVDVESFWVTVQTFATPGKLSGLIVCCYLYVLIQGLRFAMLYPGRATLWQHFGLNFGNHTGNILLPGRVGEAVRPLYLKRWWPDTPLKTVITWAIFEKGAEFASMALFIGTGLLVWGSDPNVIRSLPANLPWWIAIVMAAVVALGLWRQKKAESLSRSEKLAWAVLLSYVTWVVNTLGVLAVTGDLRVAFALLVTMTLATSVPMLPAGVGAAQWAVVALSGFMQMAEAEALAYSSALHLVWILVRLSVGFPLLFFVWGWPKPREMALVQGTVQDNKL